MIFRLKDVVGNSQIKDCYTCDSNGIVYSKTGKPLKDDRGSYKISLEAEKGIYKHVKVAISTIKESFVDNSEWRVVNYPGVREGLYLVHRDSRIKNAKRGTLVESYSKGQAEPRKKIKLYGENGEMISCYVSRVVALAWCDNDDPENKIEVDHIVPICMGGTDNADNLEWVTKDENRRRWEEFRLSKQNCSCAGSLSGHIVS